MNLQILLNKLYMEGRILILPPADKIELCFECPLFDVHNQHCKYWGNDVKLKENETAGCMIDRYEVMNEVNLDTLYWFSE